MIVYGMMTDFGLIKKQILNQSLWLHVKTAEFSTRNGIAFFCRKKILFCRNRNKMSDFQIVTGFLFFGPGFLFYPEK